MRQRHHRVHRREKRPRGASRQRNALRKHHAPRSPRGRERRGRGAQSQQSDGDATQRDRGGAGEVVEERARAGIAVVRERLLVRRLGVRNAERGARAAAAAAAEPDSSPSGHANTLVLITSQSSSARRWPSVSMEWSNSWLPRHACVTGMAFMAATAAAPRSSEERREGERKSPFRVHMYASPGSRVSSMKHLSAERLCSSYTGGEEVWDEGREGQRRRREVRGWGTRAVIFSSGVARASRFPGRRGERGRKGVDLAVAVGGCHAVRRRSRGTDEVSARGSRRSRARPSRGAHASRAPARVPVSNAEKRYAPGWREWATFECARRGARAHRR